MIFSRPVPYPGITLGSLVGLIVLLLITFSVPATASRKAKSGDNKEGSDAH